MIDGACGVMEAHDSVKIREADHNRSCTLSGAK